MTQSLKITGYLEAISWLVLLVAMWMKYGHGLETATRYPGMVHGALFMAYVAIAAVLNGEESWPRRKLFAALGLSVVPFGTLWFDRRFLRHPTG